jgi:hypothetical protein
MPVKQQTPHSMAQAKQLPASSAFYTEEKVSMRSAIYIYRLSAANISMYTIIQCHSLAD